MKNPELAFGNEGSHKTENMEIRIPGGENTVKEGTPILNLEDDAFKEDKINKVRESAMALAENSVNQITETKEESTVFALPETEKKKSTGSKLLRRVAVISTFLFGGLAAVPQDGYAQQKESGYLNTIQLKEMALQKADANARKYQNLADNYMYKEIMKADYKDFDEFKQAMDKTTIDESYEKAFFEFAKAADSEIIAGGELAGAMLQKYDGHPDLYAQDYDDISMMKAYYDPTTKSGNPNLLEPGPEGYAKAIKFWKSQVNDGQYYKKDEATIQQKTLKDVWADYLLKKGRTSEWNALFQK